MSTAIPEGQYRAPTTPEAGYQAGYEGVHATGHEKAETASIGELVADVSQGLSTLLRQEIALARAEAKQSVSQAGKAGGKFGAAALAGWMAVLFLSLAVWEWISSALDSRGWAALIVMVVWALIGAVLFSLGRRDLKNIQGMERTVATTKQVPEALKGHQEML